MRHYLALPCLLLLAACAGPVKNSGFLASYDGMTPRKDTVRARIAERKDDDALKGVQQITIRPTIFADGVDVAWLTDAERNTLLREIDAQLCFELSERYDVNYAVTSTVWVRAAVTAVRPTGRIASGVSAATKFFIPGPVGVRIPGTTGALAVEAEMISMARGKGQIAAIAWNRAATAIGTDDPSLHRLGDALQFAEPFADAAARTMTAEGVKSRDIPKPDPCEQFGARFRAGGFLAGAVTGLYVPQASGAKADKPTP